MFIHITRRMVLFCMAALLSFTLVGTASAQFGGGVPTKKTVTTFASSGQNIGLWTYEPTKPGKYPLVILLHGVEGLEGLDKYADKYDLVARRVASKGYTVYMAHYFDRTRRNSEDLKVLETNIKTALVKSNNEPVVEEVRNLFQQWMSTVGDAIKFGRQQPNVDADRVALVGFSLGGFLAMGTTVAEPNLKVDAVVEMFGGLPRELYPKMGKMPPVMILHGDKDSIVPVKEAYDLQAALMAKKNSVEQKIYPGVEHMFLGDNNQFRLDLIFDAEARTLEFLAKQFSEKK